MKIILSLLMILIINVNIFGQERDASYTDIVKVEGDTVYVTFKEIIEHDNLNAVVRYYLQEDSDMSQRTELCCKLLIDERDTITYLFRHNYKFYDKNGNSVYTSMKTSIKITIIIILIIMMIPCIMVLKDYI